jgi:ribA/ribD-fused uncharacterized protein
MSQGKQSDFVFFWGGIFSQWYPSEFQVNGQWYMTAEQYMMAEKARLFNDNYALERILESPDPMVQKEWGRKVKNFDKTKWETVCKDIVYKGNYEKFTQDPSLMKALLNTTKEIVEASPSDQIWGIGLKANNPLAWNKETWKGTNWLGEVLMKVRESLRKEEY